MSPSFMLVIEDAAYRLCEVAPGAARELAVLPGGARALLGPRLVTDEGRLEAAIATAEDWLMPYAAALRGQVLQLDDRTGRLRPALAALVDESQGAWQTPRLEQLFLRVVDLATGRHPPAALAAHAAAVADLLLLRELAHHGQLDRVCLAGQAQGEGAQPGTAPGAV